MPSATSILNYIEHRKSGKLGAQAQAIVDFLAKHPNQNWSRSELARDLGMPVASVCGRVNDLVLTGVLNARPARKCSITGKTISPVRINRLATQADQPTTHH